jgi:hypothetical protein
MRCYPFLKPLLAAGIFVVSVSFAGLVMISSTEDGVEHAKVILLVHVKNKSVKPSYAKIAGKSRLSKTTLEIFGPVKEVLYGSFKDKTFKGVFQWMNLMLYDKDGNEAGSKSVTSFESGEEGTLEEGKDWIIYINPEQKGTAGKTVFFRAENAGVRERILSIVW